LSDHNKLMVKIPSQILRVEKKVNDSQLLFLQQSNF